jgi:hypothetical protein
VLYLNADDFWPLNAFRSSLRERQAFITANGGTVASAEAVFVAGIENDMTYLNIHTTQFPNGEIRAFLTPEPLPGALAGLALAGLWMMWRRAGGASK